MNPLQTGHLPHTLHQPVSHRMQRIKVIPVETKLQRGDILIIQLFELDIRLGKMIGPRIGILVQNIFGILYRSGIDDELSIVLPSHLRSITHLKTRRRAPDERGNGLHPFVCPQHAIERIGDFSCPLHRSIGPQVDLHSKLVSIGKRHHAEF